MLITHRAQYISIFKMQVGGKEQRSDERERDWDDGLMTESDRASAAFFLTNESTKALRRCENNIPSRILETVVVPIIDSVGFSWWKSWEFMTFYNGVTPQRLRLLWGLVTYAACIWKLQGSGVPNSSQLRCVANLFWLTWFSEMLLRSCCLFVS